MQTIKRITPDELRIWRRWGGTLEAMRWLVRAAPIRRSRRPINPEDRSLCRFLNELISEGRLLTSEPAFNWQMQNFEDEYRCAEAWFSGLMRERDEDWNP